MKKLLLLTSALFFVLFTTAQIVNIPDANFKTVLVGDTLINTNQDGEIQVSEANSYYGAIHVDSLNISDLSGIESFTLIYDLLCRNNQLTTIDLSSNTELLSLHLNNNLLTNLDLSNNPNIYYLYCSGNQLSTLNVSNISVLNTLNCDNNQLTNLDVSNNINLISFNCNYNNLNTLDVSNNINLAYFVCNHNQLNTIDITNNPDIFSFDCSDNMLSTLDLSGNFNLSTFRCSSNQLTVLDLSNNPNLVILDCKSNLLQTLNLNNNVELKHLYCNGNLLNSLNVDSNINLLSLRCQYNLLNTLNLDNDTALVYLECHNNLLDRLYVKNGNNINFSTFWVYNNPNLYCIEVDDPTWSSSHWFAIDPQTTFGYNCLYDIQNPNSITGSVVLDTNCLLEGNEIGKENVIVKTDPDYFYGITNSMGAYSITTDTGTYVVENIINNPLITHLCPSPNYHTVHFDSLGMDTTGINFYNNTIACPYLTIDITSDRRRRCFTNNTYVHYCNDGFADEDSVEVYVHLPDYVIFVSANYPYTIDTLGNYVFDIGTLAQGDCGEIHIIDSVACINGITGLTQCTEAWITPPNDCVNNLDTAAYNAWDKSSVMVEGECIADTMISFTITNTGDFGLGDMQIASEYRIYEDNALVYTGSFQLLGQEELIIDIPANGLTYRLEADQHPMHPGNSHPNETIEDCGNPLNSNGLVNTMPMDDEDAEVEIDCMEIRDSYDPNDKNVSPEGITANNYIMPGTSLDYVIRFQNTGTDTAFTVVVVDTLSEYLDISTFQAGISSHPYELDVRGHGQPVLFFQFFNINLPDSNANEANSHGFVKFKIAPYDTLANGTVVQNTADIYFDYNIPVITNTSQVIISDTVIYGNPLLIHDIQKESQVTDIRIYPNPTTGKITVIAEGIVGIEVMDITGKNLQGFQNLEGLNELDLSKQPKGIYIIKVITDKQTITRKLIKQ